MPIVAHPEQVIPEHVRAQRAQAIRDKLLGQPSQIRKHTAQPRVTDPHARLHKMVKVLEDHILHSERVDPNC